MFPSSSFLLQLVTGAVGEACPVVLVGLMRPECAGGGMLEELISLTSLVFLALLCSPLVGLVSPAREPENCGLIVPDLVLVPMARGNVDDLIAFARLLKAPIHCNTWAGSFDS